MCLHCLPAYVISGEKPAATPLFPLGMQHVLFPSGYFQMVSLSLALSNSVVICLGGVFFLILVLGIHWASGIHEFTIFFKFGKISAIISPSIFFCSSPRSWRDSTYTYLQLFEVMPQLTGALLVLFFPVIFHFGWLLLPRLQVHSCFTLRCLFCCCHPTVYFYCRYCIFFKKDLFISFERESMHRG